MPCAAAPASASHGRLTLPARAGDRLTTSPLRLVPADAALPFGGPRDGGPLAIGPGTGGALAIGPAPAGTGSGRRCARETAGCSLGALGAALLLGAGCGIPAAVRRAGGRQGRHRDGGRRRSTAGGSEPPTRTASGSDNEAFVRNFLSAAAGEPDRAYERVRQFIAPEHESRLQEKKGSEVALTVVRLREAVFTAQQRLDDHREDQRAADRRAAGQRHPGPAGGDRDGVRVPAAQPAFGGTGDDERAGLYILDPPNVLLLSDDALQQYYQDEYDLLLELRPHPPGARPALPAAGGARERRVNEVVKWLVGGPSDWLRPGVVGLPDRHRADQQRHRRRTAGGRSTWTCPVTTRPEWTS